MVSRQAQKRLTKEYKSIAANPPPFIEARPNEDNILEWHYVITGPPKTPYEGGQYHGMLRFPADYPFKPPSISIVTPNGRFACNTRLCLSMSDYHPDTWNPAWSVLTILTGLLSFMTGSELTTGLIVTTDIVKRKLAAESKAWNLAENSRFVTTFPELAKRNAMEIAEEKERREQEALAKQSLQPQLPLSIDQLDAEDRARLLVQQPRPAVLFKLVGVVVAAAVAVYLYF